MTFSSERTFTWESLIGFWWQFVWPWKPGFLLFFNDCFYQSGSAVNACFFLTHLRARFLSSNFLLSLLTFIFSPPHALPPLTAFFFLFFPPFPPACLTVFVSLRLNFAHLLSALMEGDIWRAAPSAARGAGVAHLADGRMQSGEMFVKQRDYMIATPQRHSRRSLWSRKTIYNLKQQRDSEVVKPDVFVFRIGFLSEIWIYFLIIWVKNDSRKY